jgi:hypothetical protein
MHAQSLAELVKMIEKVMNLQKQNSLSIRE